MAFTISNSLLLILSLHFTTRAGLAVNIQFYTRCSTNIIYVMEDNCPFKCYMKSMYTNLMCEPDGATAVPCDPFNKTQTCLALQCTGTRITCPDGTWQRKTERLLRILEGSDSDYVPHRNHFFKRRNSDHYGSGFSSTYTYTYTILFVLLILVLVCLAANRCFKYYSDMFKGSPDPPNKPDVPTISLGVHLEVDPLSRAYSRSTTNLSLNGPNASASHVNRSSSAPPPSTVTIQVRPAHDRSSVGLSKDMPPPYSVATQLSVPPPAYEDINHDLIPANHRHI